MANLGTMLPQEVEEPWRRLIRKPEHDLMSNVLLRSVAGDPTKDRNAIVDRAVDRVDIAPLHVGEDSIARRGEMDQMPLDMTLCTEGEIHKWVPGTGARGQRR